MMKHRLINKLFGIWIHGFIPVTVSLMMLSCSPGSVGGNGGGSPLGGPLGGGTQLADSGTNTGVGGSGDSWDDSGDSGYVPSIPADAQGPIVDHPFEFSYRLQVNKSKSSTCKINEQNVLLKLNARVQYRDINASTSDQKKSYFQANLIQDYSAPMLGGWQSCCGNRLVLIRVGGNPDSCLAIPTDANGEFKVSRSFAKSAGFSFLLAGEGTVANNTQDFQPCTPFEDADGGIGVLLFLNFKTFPSFATTEQCTLDIQDNSINQGQFKKAN